MSSLLAVNAPNVIFHGFKIDTVNNKVRPTDRTSVVHAFIEQEHRILPGLVEDFEEMKATGQLPDVVLFDFTTFSGQTVADIFGIPSICHHIGIYLDRRELPTWLPGFRNVTHSYKDSSIYHKLLNIQEQFVILSGKYTAFQNSNEIRKSLGKPEWRSFVDYLTGLTLVRSYKGFDYPVPLNGLAHYIGIPTHTLQEAENRVFQDEQLLKWTEINNKPIVYVSLGSEVRDRCRALTNIIGAIKDFTVVRSVIAFPGTAACPAFDQIVASDSMVALNWVNQKKFLQSGKVDLFITHGGFSSITDATLGGVPMLCIPHDGDQFVNCRRLEEMGIALRTHANENIIALKSLIFGILTNPELKNNFKQYQRLIQLQEGGVDYAVNLIEYVAEYGDSMFVMELNTWITEFNIDLIGAGILIVAFLWVLSLLFCWKLRGYVNMSNRNKIKVE